MLDFTNNDNAVFIQAFPFPDVDISKDQAKKILEESAEAYGAFQDWIKHLMYIDDHPEEKDDNVTNAYVAEFIVECCDTVQAVVNLLYACSQKDISRLQETLAYGMADVINKNAARGYYGEPDEEEQTED